LERTNSVVERERHELRPEARNRRRASLACSPPRPPAAPTPPRIVPGDVPDLEFAVDPLAGYLIPAAYLEPKVGHSLLEVVRRGAPAEQVRRQVRNRPHLLLCDAVPAEGGQLLDQERDAVGGG